MKLNKCFFLIVKGNGLTTALISDCDSGITKCKDIFVINYIFI